jgi:transcriptional regulator with XRE-family HTH domain
VAAKKSTPTIRLRRLAGQLRRLRESTGLRREDVEDRTGLHSTTLYRIETARSRPQYRTFDMLLKLYGVPTDEQIRLKALYKQSAGEGWIQPWHESLREEYTTYISFEREAHGIRHYSASPDKVEDRVRTRMERQAVLTQERPIKLWAIIDEAALHHEVGGRDVMLAQLDRLGEAATAPNTTIQVVPFSAGAHLGMPGQFLILDFDDPLDTDLVYIDSQAGEIFLESDTDIERFRDSFEHLVAVAMSPEDSVGLIAEIADCQGRRRYG